VSSVFTVLFNVTGFPGQPWTGGVLWEDPISSHKALIILTTPSGGIGVLRDYNDELVWNWSFDGLVDLMDPATLKDPTKVLPIAEDKAMGCNLMRLFTTMQQPAFGWLATAVQVGPNRWQAHPTSSFYTPGNDLADIFELLGDDSTSGPVTLTLGTITGHPNAPAALTVNNNSDNSNGNNNNPGGNQGLLFDSFSTVPIPPTVFSLPKGCPT
jgi:hypothetical protein